MVHALFVGHEISYHSEISSNKNTEPMVESFCAVMVLHFNTLDYDYRSKYHTFLVDTKDCIKYPSSKNLLHNLSWRKASIICVAGEDIYSEAPRAEKLSAELRIQKSTITSSCCYSHD